MEGPNYNILFNKNNYDGKWYCFRRQDFNLYYSDRNSKDAQIASGETQEESFKNWKDEFEK